MNIIINGVKARVKVFTLFPPQPSIGPVTRYILVVGFRCDKGQVPELLFNRLTDVFREHYSGVAPAEAPENGYIEFRCLGIKTELEAIDFMRDAGFQVTQQPPR